MAEFRSRTEHVGDSQKLVARFFFPRLKLSDWRSYHRDRRDRRRKIRGWAVEVVAADHGSVFHPAYRRTPKFRPRFRPSAGRSRVAARAVDCRVLGPVRAHEKIGDHSSRGILYFRPFPSCCNDG